MIVVNGIELQWNEMKSLLIFACILILVIVMLALLTFFDRSSYTPKGRSSPIQSNFYIITTLITLPLWIFSLDVLPNIDNLNDLQPDRVHREEISSERNSSILSHIPFSKVVLALTSLASGALVIMSLINDGIRIQDTSHGVIRYGVFDFRDYASNQILFDQLEFTCKLSGCAVILCKCLCVVVFGGSILQSKPLVDCILLFSDFTASRRFTCFLLTFQPNPIFSLKFAFRSIIISLLVDLPQLASLLEFTTKMWLQVTYELQNQSSMLKDAKNQRWNINYRLAGLIGAFKKLECEFLQSWIFLSVSGTYEEIWDAFNCVDTENSCGVGISRSWAISRKQRNLLAHIKNGNTVWYPETLYASGGGNEHLNQRYVRHGAGVNGKPVYVAQNGAKIEFRPKSLVCGAAWWWLDPQGYYICSKQTVGTLLDSTVEWTDYQSNLKSPPPRLKETTCLCYVCDSRDVQEQMLMDPFWNLPKFRRAAYFGIFNSKYDNMSSLESIIATSIEDHQVFAEQAGFFEFDMVENKTVWGMKAALQRFYNHCVALGVEVVLLFMLGHGLFGRNGPLLLGTNAEVQEPYVGEDGKEIVQDESKLGISESWIHEKFEGMKIHTVWNCCLKGHKTKNLDASVSHRTAYTSLRVTEVYETKENFGGGKTRVITTLLAEQEKSKQRPFDTLANIFYNASCFMGSNGESVDFYDPGHVRQAGGLEREILYAHGSRKCHHDLSSFELRDKKLLLARQRVFECVCRRGFLPVAVVASVLSLEPDLADRAMTELTSEKFLEFSQGGRIIKSKFGVRKSPSSPNPFQGCHQPIDLTGDDDPPSAVNIQRPASGRPPPRPAAGLSLRPLPRPAAGQFRRPPPRPAARQFRRIPPCPAALSARKRKPSLRLHQQPPPGHGSSLAPIEIRAISSPRVRFGVQKRPPEPNRLPVPLWQSPQRQITRFG